MAERTLISIYKHSKDNKDVDFALEDFVSGVKSGTWQDAVLRVRTIEDKKERDEAKKKCPMVTVSGSFVGRADNSLRKHSGYIAIDIDRVENANAVKELVANDKYVYAAFISISGQGVCLLFRIDPTKHAESFEGIGAYLYENYQLIIDQSCKNVSRSRFISYDPFLVSNTAALLFKKYPKKSRKTSPPKVVVVKTDFDEIINQMQSRGINICEDYAGWIACAYSLVSEFGEEGRGYFHILSAQSGKYASEDCDKQYDTCLHSHKDGKSKQATIASIYHYAKQAGIDTYSARTKEIIRATQQQTRAGMDAQGVGVYLQKFQSIPIVESEPIIEQVITKNIEFTSENVIEDIVGYLGQYNLRQNLITRNIEIGDTRQVVDDTVLNSIYIDLRTINDKITKDLVCSVIFSNRTTSYNPFKDFLESGPDWAACKSAPNLSLLLHAIKSDTVNYDRWVTKWLVGIIASAYGNYSPLTLVLAGELQGTGKTHFFRYLLPKQLRNLYAESDMDDGKDDAILMTKKLIILDDEYGGKSKKEFAKMKKITSKEWVNVREPYGRVASDLRRLAMFAGTSNDLQILYDPTGNRRVIPVHIVSEIDRKLFNECDKSELFHELYAMYKQGYDYSILREDMVALNANTDHFKQSSPEEELIATKLEHGNSNSGEWLTITRVINHLIEDTKISGMSNTKVGMILTALKYPKKRAKISGTVVTVFFVSRTSGTMELI